MIELESVLFYLFAAIIVFAAVRVVLSTSPVHAAMYLVLAFFTASALWILLQAEFLALILFLVYVGAVMVLFLFIVMLMNAELTSVLTLSRRYKMPAMIVGKIMAIELIGLVFHGFYKSERILSQIDPDVGLSERLGKLLFTDYLYPVEVAAAVLLVALVAAVTLTLRRRTDAKYTDASASVKVSAAQRLTLVKMPAEKIAPLPESTDISQEKK